MGNSTVTVRSFIQSYVTKLVLFFKSPAENRVAEFDQQHKIEVFMEQK